MNAAAIPDPETVWSAGRLDADTGPQRLLFGQMYEDPRIEVAAFEGRRRVFCIASAGSTALHLAAWRGGTEHIVTACDINPVQLDYARRRALGEPRRIGDAERAMNFARTFMPLVGWGPRQLREFCQLDNPAHQLACWRRHFDTVRFRLAFDAMLSRPLLRAVYSPQFLSFLPPHFGAVMRARWERGFALHPNADNPYAAALLLGDAVDGPIHSASKIEFILGDAASCLERCPPASFDAFTLSNILDGAAPAYRTRLAAALLLGDAVDGPIHSASKIEFILGDAASCLERCPPASFDAFTLSNILDGAAPAYRTRLAAAVRHAAREDAVVVLRSFAEPTPAPTQNHAAPNHAAANHAAPNHAAEDRSMLWGIINIRRADSCTDL